MNVISLTFASAALTSQNVCCEKGLLMSGKSFCFIVFCYFIMNLCAFFQTTFFKCIYSIRYSLISFGFIF